MKTKQYRTIFLSLISLVIIAAFIFYLYTNADRFRELLHLSLSGLILLLVLSLFMSFSNGLITTYMFRGLGAGLSQREGFLLASASTLVNQLPIPGGIVTRAVYLKYKYELSYAKYFSAQLALFVCTLAVYGMLGLVILLYWVLIKHIIVSPVLFIAFGLMACTLISLWLPMDRFPIPKMILKWVNQALEGWKIISKNLILLLQLLGFQTASMLILAARYWLAFHMLSQNVTISQVILFASASVLTQLVSFAPGGLGVREAIVGGLAAAIGFQPGISVVAVGLDRLVATIVIVVIGWASTVLLGKEISQGSFNQDEEKN